MTKQEEVDLFKSADRLIKSKAWEFHCTFLSNIEYEDLLQEGYETFCKAVKKFENNRQVMFTTFLFPYLTRKYIDLYNKSHRRKNSRFNLEELKEIEETQPIFPAKYKVGTYYPLDDIDINAINDNARRGASGDGHPVLAESQLQVPPQDAELEIKEILNKIDKSLDSTARKVLSFLLCTPKEFAEFMRTQNKNGKTTNRDFCNFLNISTYSFDRSLRQIKTLLVSEKLLE